MSLLDICQWLQATNVSTYLRESTSLWPILEGSHLLGMAFMMAPVMMYDMRLIGVLWKKDPVSKVKWQFLPITFAGALVMTVTGTLLLWSEPVKCYNSLYFRIKVVGLILATLNAVFFHLTIDKKTAEWDMTLPPPSRARTTGYLSLALWSLVIFAGRYTAYNL
ncbi:MAG TPA: hypothetical protein VGN17_12895 [Bryobacteraceae bacterium]|jgi:hypothetical protein